ncbi:hypothetical protein [Halomarina rubra]|uniref:Uncharacterized protein n=1 Tax=Halomarina rubra TaxID=2071873 RepID=A0ABD6AVF3_9EURY|nr:hypothetical protein [Halomarina rubra]
MVHDRIHARRPDHHVDRWTEGVVPTDGTDPVELRVTLAVRDLFVGRLDLGPEASPVGERVWFRKHGGR